MFINFKCVDFGSGDPVPGVALACTITIMPRVLVLGAQHEDPKPGPPTSLKTNAAAGTPGAKRVKLLKDEAVSKVLSPKIAGPDGVAHFEVDVEPEYQRQKAAHPPGAFEQFLISPSPSGSAAASMVSRASRSPSTPPRSRRPLDR